MSGQDRLKERMAAVFGQLADSAEPGFQKRQEEFAFHMADWKDDLGKMAALYSEPDRFSDDEAMSIVQAFLYHASSHVVAAARLADMFLDTFKKRD